MRDDHSALKKLIERGTGEAPETEEVEARELVKTPDTIPLCACGKRCKLVQCFVKDPYYLCEAGHKMAHRPRAYQNIKPLDDKDLLTELGEHEEEPDGPGTPESE